MLCLWAHTLAYAEHSICIARHQLYGQHQNVNAMHAGLFDYTGMACALCCSCHSRAYASCLALLLHTIALQNNGLHRLSLAVFCLRSTLRGVFSAVSWLLNLRPSVEIECRWRRA